MTDLPSRDAAKYDPDLYHSPQRSFDGKNWFDWWYEVALPIIEAYRDGQLVDLDTIDWEMVSAWLTTLTPNEGRDVAKRLHEQADAAARILLDAIGDTG